MIDLGEIRSARERIAGAAIRTPLVRLADTDVWLKLEVLQPIGSFKIRGAANAMALMDPVELARGVVTASAGNMAQGVAWNARRLGAGCTVVVPDHAPDAKVQAVERLGGRVLKVPFDEWWQAFVDRGRPGLEGAFVHAFDDERVMAGNGTIGLELLEDLPDVETILVPWGGGGLASGIASAVRALRPACRVLAVEVETGAPLTAALAAGEPVTVDYRPSFVDGIGSKTVFASMLDRAQRRPPAGRAGARGGRGRRGGAGGGGPERPGRRRPDGVRGQRRQHRSVHAGRAPDGLTRLPPPSGGDSSAVGPAAPARHTDLDHRAGRWALAVLRVLLTQQPDRPGALLLGLDDPRLAVRPDPPQPLPIVLVAVHQHRHARVLADVAEAAQVRRALGLVVHRVDDPIAHRRERERDDVRSAVRARGGESRHPGAGQPLPRLRLAQVHHSQV